MELSFDWERILLNGLPLKFLFEVAFRSAVMFLFLLLVIRLTGKRGVKQLSVFEIVIIISLGSAAGDPMFYEDVGILPALMVFFIILILYRGITWITGRSEWFEKLIEGKTECLITEGKFSFQKFDQESLAQDEFFTELRLKHVEHLGQVKKAYLETTGDVSIFFYEDNDVKYGLPIIPELFCEKSTTISTAGLYACSHCGLVVQHGPGRPICPDCRNTLWVAAINTRRTT
jgi:uncharacterized membrane protein YcaP (DUF421 family)